MKTIAISNYKGGVGKTTTAVNLASVLSSRGNRVLLVDLDPQASATDYYNLYDEGESSRKTTIELLYGNAPVSEVVHKTSVENLSVVPSIIDLVDQNELLLHEQTLKFALADAADDFDFAIIDCSPVMKRLAVNAYLAASSDGMVIIPVKLDGSVMRGTALTINAMHQVSNALRLPTPNFRILRTCVPGRSTRSESTGAEILDRFFEGQLFDTCIHSSTKVCEGSWEWKAVVDYAPSSRPAQDYVSLAKEVCHELA